MSHDEFIKVTRVPWRDQIGGRLVGRLRDVFDQQPKDGGDDPFTERDTRAALQTYAEFQQTDSDFGLSPLQDPSGPRGLVVTIRPRELSRLAVDGRLIIQTSQYDRIKSWLADQGISIETQEDDRWGLGVSLLGLAGSDPQALYTAIVNESENPTPGSEPLAMSLDDVTYENIVLKPAPPVRPLAGGGQAGRAESLGPRPTGTGRGKGITVGVIDGGFEPADAPKRTDGWLDNVTTVTDGYSSLTQAAPGVLDPGAGHGTFVTGVLLRHAPDAEIRQYRAVDSHGFGSSWRLMDCLMQAVDDGCQILNCSLGFEDPHLVGNPALSAALHRIRQDTDVLIVAAAGNSGTTTPMLPAAHKATVGVGGTETDLDPLVWSNRGPWVDCSTIADPVTSIYVVDPADPGGDVNPWGTWYGTSFAAPKVTGELATLLGQQLAPDDALEHLFATSPRPPSSAYGYLLDLS
ncbi:S8/S53 family peptidase [Nostocoides vanveenii]|jgi:subtilisin family serine protease|uniref:Peptidase S8/S53 domain-containing protein n=1 Tax=Nostocoides vanveenii TaxID=330835 RepID=A0ABN2KT92_9MICO